LAAKTEIVSAELEKMLWPRDHVKPKFGNEINHRGSMNTEDEPFTKEYLEHPIYSEGEASADLKNNANP